MLLVYSHAAYLGCAVGSIVMHCMTGVSFIVMKCMAAVGSSHAGDYDHAVGSVIMQDTMTVLLALQSCRGI